MTEPIKAVLQRRKADRPKSEFVFASTSTATGHLVDIRRHHELVIKDSKVQFDLHDLRRTFASVAANLRLPPYVVKALLNHRTKADIIQYHYLEFELDVLRPAMESINSHLLSYARSM